MHLVQPNLKFFARDKVVDFHWNSVDPWTVVSVSDDCSSSAGGGTLQVIKFLLLITSDAIMISNPLSGPFWLAFNFKSLVPASTCWTLKNYVQEGTSLLEA